MAAPARPRPRLSGPAVAMAAPLAELVSAAPVPVLVGPTTVREALPEWKLEVEFLPDELPVPTGLAIERTVVAPLLGTTGAAVDRLAGAEPVTVWIEMSALVLIPGGVYSTQARSR